MFLLNVLNHTNINSVLVCNTLLIYKNNHLFADAIDKSLPKSCILFCFLTSQCVLFLSKHHNETVRVYPRTQNKTEWCHCTMSSSYKEMTPCRDHTCKCSCYRISVNTVSNITIAYITTRCNLKHTRPFFNNSLDTYVELF